LSVFLISIRPAGAGAADNITGAADNNPGAAGNRVGAAGNSTGAIDNSTGAIASAHRALFSSVSDFSFSSVSNNSRSGACMKIDSTP
jgi:hypothetical protein